MRVMLHKAQDENKPRFDYKSHEIDVRADMSLTPPTIRLSHDPTKNLRYCYNLATYSKTFQPEEIAINVKEDGIARMINDQMKGLNTQFFLFDMSIPELVKCVNEEIPVAFRVSEYESVGDLDFSNLRNRVNRIWLDCFEGEEEKRQLSKITHIKKVFPTAKVYIVSPELHGRSLEKGFVKNLKRLDERFGGLTVCTDKPEFYE